MDFGDVQCPNCGRSMAPLVCKCVRCGISISGVFSVSPLARLSTPDQALVIAFLRSFGSIKKIQEVLDVSYPTARSRIEKIVEHLDALMEGPSDTDEVLEKLSTGEISFPEALDRL